MTTAHAVTLVGTFSIRPENVKEFKKNCKAIVALHDQEPGLIASAYSFEGDGHAISREDYENAEAVIQHMSVGRHIYERTRQIVEITGVDVSGPAGELEKLRTLFADLSPRWYVTEVSFRR